MCKVEVILLYSFEILQEDLGRGPPSFDLHWSGLATVIILNTISKRQDGLGFIGKNGYIFHDSSHCIEVLIGGAYSHMFEDLLQVISYNIPLFSLIQMLKFVLHILNLK